MNDRIAEEGYAVRKDLRRHGGLSLWEDYSEWIYPTLHERQTYHFASQVFGSLHSLSILSQSGDEYTLAYCPLRRNRPSIEGMLTIGADLTFLSATWSFQTPKPHEHAGGEVTFAPPAGHVPSLLATRGLFWRRLPNSRRYYQRSTIHVNWQVSPDTTLPPLLPLPRVSP